MARPMVSPGYRQRPGDDAEGGAAGRFGTRLEGDDGEGKVYGVGDNLTVRPTDIK